MIDPIALAIEQFRAQDPKTWARFWSKIRETETGCWVWTGWKTYGGYKNYTRQCNLYAKFSYKNRHLKGHVFAHDILSGRICPKGYDRHHTCETSLCVNPYCIEAIPKAQHKADHPNGRIKRNISCDAIPF